MWCFIRRTTAFHSLSEKHTAETRLHENHTSSSSRLALQSHLRHAPGRISIVVSHISFTPGTTGRQLRSKTPGYDQFPPAVNSWGSILPIPWNNPTSTSWRGRPTNIKRTNRSDEPRCHSSALWLSMGRRDFITCPPYPTTWKGNLGLRMSGGSPMRISITHCGSRVASSLSTGHNEM
jgi:hypothetical protein